MGSSTTTTSGNHAASVNDAKDLASGTWHVANGNGSDFVKRWTEFLEWTRDSAPGFLRGILMQDEADANHYVSVAFWESKATRAAWQSSAGFGEKLAACRALCSDFAGASYELASAVVP